MYTHGKYSARIIFIKENNAVQSLALLDKCNANMNHTQHIYLSICFETTIL